MKIYCHKCLTNTAWAPIKGGEQCVDCETKFPCTKKTCGHVDCYQYRGKASKVKEEPLELPSLETVINSRVVSVTPHGLMHKKTKNAE